MGVTVTDEDVLQYLDYPTIYAACDQIDTIASDFATMGQAISDLSSEFGYDTLHVEGQTLENSIVETGNAYADYSSAGETLAQKIKSATAQAVRTIKSQLRSSSGTSDNGSSST